MRGIVYAVIVSLLFLAPLERVNIADLLPIRAVALYLDGDAIVLETDTEHKGDGSSAVIALQDLKKNTPAVVYLDTAEYLLVSKAAVRFVEELRDSLKPSVKVCVCDAADKVEAVAAYLDVHGDLPKLKHWNPE